MKSNPAPGGPGRATASWMVWPLLAIAFFMYVVNTGGYDLWAPDEPRYAEIAREMLVTGDWATPRVNNERYLEKPPLFFWAIAALSLPAGEVTEWSARLPSAIAAVAVLWLSFLLARSMFGVRAGLWTVVVLATSGAFWWQARTAQLDMVLTACTTAALWAFWRQSQKYDLRYVIVFYGALVAAVLLKGPPGYLFAAFLVLAYYWGRRDLGRGVHFVLGSLVVWAAFFAWYIPVHAVAPAAEAAHQISAWENVYRNTIGRLLGGSKFDPYPWTYVRSTAFDFLPWTLFAPWVAPWVWKRRNDGEAMRVLLSWIVPAFIFFSLIVTKRSIYILPLYPAIAILVGASLPGLMDSAHALWRRRTGLVWAGVLMVVAVAPFGLLLTEYAYLWRMDLLLVSAVGLVFGVDMLRRAFRTECRNVPAAMAIHFAVIAVLASLFVLPAVNDVKGAGAFCEPVREAVAAGHEVRVYSLAFSREEYIFYARQPHTRVLTDFVPIEVDSGMSHSELAESERRMFKAIAKAVNVVPIASYDPIAKNELEELQSALDSAAASHGVNPDLLDAFESALANELERFHREFAVQKPGFAFVETENWRWMLPLRPELATLPVIQKRNVGSREMLLLGNQAAARVVAALDRPSGWTGD